ncbi:Rho GTPase activation protein [Penicillium expansum]|uniref:Rho GTPase activation protein n=1 Tax=Penicillium expansum TaxID=27334 RepID=A0A0A2I2X5_PENEN|nr:Rho GTPase activation protein [Penicillium expansum]KGO36833.1 Rho GTPase activation protein [Penicillium expansum]KGO37660.1 Rho GTPase activation protein [Penicillium expansum]KGO60861.1 Rho GTPase activation protein [Penicillium expansum]
MENQGAYPESPMEQDESYPCKGCGETLEEGKAFELAGNRWHIDCFRCSTCSTLLDSDAHLLLLGDGSLICSNCTYSCSSCNNKIEDLAILTGDQAFCAQCFRCRNCKRKIENLRYARTSQGIFCMECHESLMARRRKRKAGGTSGKKPAGPNVKLDKSLPSLPPHLLEEAQLMDEETSEYTGTPDPSRMAETPDLNDERPGSSVSNQQADSDNILLPSSTYRSSRQSIPRNTDADGGELLIPLAFDPSAEGHSSRGHSQTRQEPSGDYFNQVQSECSHGASRDGREYMQEPTSRTSLENHSPHIAYQEKGWERNDANPADKSPLPISDSSKLAKESSTRSSSDIPISFREAGNFSGPTSPDSSRSKEFSSDSKRHIPMDNVDSAVARSSSELRRLHDYGSMESPRSQPSGLPHLPKRGDSLESKLHQIQRKEVGSSPASSQYGDSPMLRSDTFEQPIQSSALNTSPLESHQYDGAGASTLLRYNSGGDFSMDEELSRIIGGDDTVGQNNESFLRRVSNSVRHGRSYSEKSVRVSKDLKNPRSPSNRSIAGTDVGTPIAGSQSEEISWLRNELRKERLRVSELESAARTAAAVKQVNTELSEKRSTMVVLDAQREIVLRELTVLTDHMEAEKRGGPSGPLDLGKLSNHVLRELAESIQKLKDSYAPQIEELMQKRNDLTEELEAMNTQKEKSFQEFEQLSMKNAQLAELNNQLVHQIQELYKATEGQPRPNGLGISHNKQRSTNSIEVMKPSFNEYQGSVSTAHISEDSEPATATVVPGPQVVSIRKGQPRKFNWKKGGQNVAKGVKGLKGAFMSSEGGQTQEGGGGIPRSQTQDPSRQGFGFFGNQRGKQGGKMSQADSVPVLAEAAPDALFGTELEARMEHEKSIIPAIVTRCIQEVELRGMDMEGIYRKSGAASVIQTIREGFERSPFDYDISDPDLDIHAVTSTLKQYFRKLPNPLITYEVYELVIDSAEVNPMSARIELMQKSLLELPRVHRDVLEFLVFHLKRVVERHEENLMTSQNVAVVFAPTIMRPESLAREMTDVQKKNDVLKFLVENCQEVFMGMQG